MTLIPFEIIVGEKTVTGKIEDDITTRELDPIIREVIKIKSVQSVDIDIITYQKLITLACVKECSVFQPGSLKEWDELGSKTAKAIMEEAVKYYPLVDYLTQMISTVAGSSEFSISDTLSVLTSSDGTKKQ